MSTFISSSSAQQLAWTDHGDPAGTTIDSNTLVIPAPAGISAGDILVAAVVGEHYGSISTPTASDPTWTRILYSSSITLFWKVATGSEPSSYTFTTAVTCLINGIIGCWSGWTGPIRKTLVADSGFKDAFAQNLIFAPDPPHVVDIDSITLEDVTAPIETTTGGLLVTFFDTTLGIENFDGTIGTEGNPPYPATVPYADTFVSGPDVQHEQIYYYGTPRAGEHISYPLLPGITYRAGNHMLTLASIDAVAGDVPGTTATFTWQHAGAEAGLGEAVWGVRLLLEAELQVGYWGILVKPL